MKKYVLISAVSAFILTLGSSASADPVSGKATVKVSADIYYDSEIAEVQNLDFGGIVLTPGFSEAITATVPLDGDTITFSDESNARSIGTPQRGKVCWNNFQFSGMKSNYSGDINASGVVVLTNTLDESSILEFTPYLNDDRSEVDTVNNVYCEWIVGSLDIPVGAAAGHYEGTFTWYAIYEGAE